MRKRIISSSVMLSFVILTSNTYAEEKMPINATAGQCFTKSFYQRLQRALGLSPKKELN